MCSSDLAAQFDFAPGEACANAAIGLDVYPGQNRVFRTFYDKDGNPIRYLAAGKGNKLVFTNADTGASVTYKTGGSVEHVTPNADGSETWVTTGHEVMILFPTDDPAGPSTTMYVGRLVFNFDPVNYVIGIRSFTGKSVDICAALGA